MQPADIAQLVSLLDQLKAEGLAVPHMPFEVLRAFRGLVMQATVEVLLPSRTGARDFLLTYRDDAYWKGWHIPGGFVAPAESLPEACSRVARRELGTNVALKQFLGAYSWPEHDYASVTSIVCLCESAERPAEGRYFAEIPPDVLANHRPFLEAYLRGTTFAG